MRIVSIHKLWVWLYSFRPKIIVVVLCVHLKPVNVTAKTELVCFYIEEFICRRAVGLSKAHHHHDGAFVEYLTLMFGGSLNDCQLAKGMGSRRFG